MNPSSTNYTIGENGSLEYTAEGVGDPRVALFFALVRNLPDERLNSLLSECLNSISSLSEVEASSVIADIFVLVWQTRDCRGGKGEKALFYKMLMQLHGKFPKTTVAAINLCVEYGYYKDFFQMLEMIGEDGSSVELKEAILNAVAEQLKQDAAALDGPRTDSAPNISLCAKYAPREKSHFSKAAKSSFRNLKDQLFPSNIGKNRKLYRKMITDLTKALDVPEVKMCTKKYSEIKFAKVPSLCANRNRKAFLNEKVKGTCTEIDTGNRFPTDADRVTCRQQFREAILSKKVHGKQLYPHEIITQIQKNRNISTLEIDLMDAQWTAIRNDTLEKLAAVANSEESAAMKVETDSAVTAATVNVGKLVPLVDVSGSMSGIPMQVAVALGILISEINHPAFRNRAITFHETPSWVNLTDCTNIVEKSRTMHDAPWGGSTSISKAFDLILQVVEANRLSPDEIPDLIVFSDMQFDQADHGMSRSGETHMDLITKKFGDVGRRICGQPYAPPRIIYWNLRGDTAGFPVTATHKNVSMLSGYSPSLLKTVLEGQPLPTTADTEEGEEETGGKKSRADKNSYDTLRKVLDDERYFPVRTLLSSSTEGVLQHYTFVPPPVVAAGDTSSAAVVAVMPSPPSSLSDATSQMTLNPASNLPPPGPA